MDRTVGRLERMVVMDSHGRRRRRVVEETGQVELERLLLDPQRARPEESADVALPLVGILY